MKAMRSLIAVLISLSLVALSPGYGCYQAMAQVVGAAAPVTAAPGAPVGAVGAIGTVGSAQGVSGLAPMRLDLKGGGLLQPSMAKPDLRGATPQAAALPHAAPASVKLPAAAAAAQRQSAAPVRLAPVSNASRAPPMSPMGAVEAHRTAPGGAAAQAAVIAVKTIQTASPLKAPQSGATAKPGQATVAEQKYFGAASAQARAKGVKTALEGLQQPLPSGLDGMSAAQAAGALNDDFLSRIGAYGRRSFSRNMPVEDDEPSTRSDPDDTSDLDELGNPRRQTDPGPDDISDDGADGSGDRGGNSELFSSVLDRLHLGRLMPASFSKSSKSSRSSRMPVEDDSRDSTSPDDISGLDELGNPRRQTDPGPDSVNDNGGGGYSEDGGSRGNSELFGSALGGFGLGAGAMRFVSRLMPQDSPFGRLLPASLSSRGAEAAASSSRRSGSRSMPSVEPDRSGSDSPDDTSDLDENGNPRRQTDPGPDDVNDNGGGGYSEDGGGSRNSDLFAVAAPVIGGLALAGGLAAVAPSALAVIPLYLGIVVPSLILHEMGHALAADKLGDSTARKQGRLSFRPRDLLTHIDPFFTLVLPIVTVLATGAMFGGARPVQVDPSNFSRPTRDMARVALAGPATNFAIAVAASLAHAAVAAIGVPGVVPSLLSLTVFFNVMLGMFNLLPFFPLDGHHLVRYIVSDVLGAPGLAAKLDARGGAQVVALVATLALAGGALVGAVSAVSGFLLAAPMALLQAPSLASLAPVALAAGLLAGQHGGRASRPAAAASQGVPGAAAPAATGESMHTFIVRLNEGGRQLTQDMHMDLVGGYGTMAFQVQAAYQAAMSQQLEAAGIGRSVLNVLGARPVAVYRRINTATIQVPESQAAALKRTLEAGGHKVFENGRRDIVRPIEMRPGYQKPMDADRWGRGLSMKDTLKLSTMDKVHEETRKLWGAPTGSIAALAANSVLKLLGVQIPQPKVGVIDTGVEKGHQLVRTGLAAAKDIRPDGDGADDVGHGTWVTSMVMWFAPWLRNVTHYKAFTEQGASTDDVLKALTMAANDGNIVISNSWGDTSGDPASPDSQLVKKLAQEGHILVFAAGNEGYSGPNTIGNPAIVHYRDPRTKAPRVIAVAATNANKKVAMFSSKGPGSETTSKDEQYKDYPRKPDAAEEGADTESAWPSYLSPDRVDPELGPVKSISGTSMSTPKLAGTIGMLAQAFGVTKVGEDLDRIVNAVMGTLTNELGQKPESIGDGFSAAYAAYQKLKAEGMVPVGLNRLQKAALGVASWLGGRAEQAEAGEVPLNDRLEHRELLKEQRALLSQMSTGLVTYGPAWAPGVVRQETAEKRMAEIARRLEVLEAAHPGLR